MRRIPLTLPLLILSMLMTMHLSPLLHASQPNWMMRDGSIGNALTMTDGNNVCLDAVVIDKIMAHQQPSYFVIRECFSYRDRIVVMTQPDPELRLGMIVDVEGQLATLPNGCRAIIHPRVWGYTDQNGNLLRHGPLIKGPLARTYWEWMVDLTVTQSASEVLGTSNTLSGTGEPNASPAESASYYAKVNDILRDQPDWTGRRDSSSGISTQSCFDGIPVVRGLPDGSLVELQCKGISAVGNETINGIAYNYLDLMENPPATDTIRAYYSNTVAVTDRVNTITGQIRHTNPYTPVIDINIGPNYDPQLLEGRLTTASQGTIAWAKTFPDASSVTLESKVIIADRQDLSSNRLYVEEPDRTGGILIRYDGSETSATRDSVVNITGVIQTLPSGERYIDAGTSGIGISGVQNSLRCLGLANKAFGGGDFNTFTTGINTPPGVGIHNIGLLAKAWGRVTGSYPSEKYFYIDDGSALDDTNAHGAIGLRVSWDWQNLDGSNSEIVPPPAGCNVAVVGVSSAESIGSGNVIRVVRPRSQDDISFYPSDTTPPSHGNIASCPYTGDDILVVNYAGVTDDYSGINHLEFYYKCGESGNWTYLNSSQSTPSGAFSLIATTAGTYYFGLVAEDNAGNRSAYPPSSICRTVYDPAFSAATGRIAEHTDYLYPGGPAKRRTILNESGDTFRQIVNNYGNEGELLSVSGDAQAIAYTYDSLYRVKTITDGNGNTTAYTYDDSGNPNAYDPPLGRLKKIQYPGGDTIQFVDYDAVGRVLKVIDPCQTVINYTYSDTAGLPTDIIYPATPELNVHFEYDPVYGRLSSVQDGSGTHSYTYDNAGMPLLETTTYTGLPQRSVGYQYYADGSLKVMTTPAGDFNYSYDATGRPVGMTNPFGNAFSWSYFSNDWPQTQSSPVSTASYSYNTRGLLTTLSNRKPDETLLSQFTVPSDSTGYDAARNLLSITASLPNVGPEFSGTTNYSYNNLDRLLQEQSTRNSGYSYPFVYDGAGNPTTFKGITRTYNAKNQNDAYTFNANGNPSPYHGNTLTYDAQNRLTAFGTEKSAGYTFDGLRAWIETASGRIYYLYSGSTPICELNAAGEVTAVNTFGPNGLLARRQGLQNSFYTFDPHGSVSQALDESGVVTATQLYDAYGTLLAGTPTYPYGFAAQHGYLTDQETGLQLLTHRYYDPSEGRFLTRDPIGYAGGINLYSYVGNNPVNAIDPSGFCGERDGIQQLGDFACGLADAGTFGLTGAIRDWMGTSGQVNMDSGLYLTGQVAGTVASSIITGGAGGARGPAALQGRPGWAKGFLARKAVVSEGSELELRTHHIVEQRSIERFGKELINSSDNLADIEKGFHQKVSNFYSSKHEWLTGEGHSTVRQWMNTMDFEGQSYWGRKIMKNIAEGAWQ